MALKKSEIYSTLTKCANKLRSNSGIGAESFKNYVLILLFLKYVSDRVKTGEKTLLTIPEGCSFDDIIALKGKKTIGDEINKIIGKIADENDIREYIQVEKHDFCSTDLGSPEDASKLISELVAAFQHKGLDFSQNRAADDDLIGDAYEYLMRNFASQAGKDKGQFYTPTEVSRLMAMLIGVDQDERPQISAYDPTCGSGSLLLRVRAAAKNNVSLDGQDIDPANIELSYLNMVIHGCETADIKCGDTLNKPQHKDNGQLRRYDYIVSNPKFSLHNWMNGAQENDEFGRWNSEIGIPPQQYGDFAFLLHCVRSMKHDGKCAIILPNGVLTRGGDEERIRKWLVDDQHLLSGIIAFPANAFFGTSIAGNVLILDKHRVNDGVFFIDASGLGYKDADSKIRLREQDIKRVVDVWRAREDVPHFAKLSTYEKYMKEGEVKPMYDMERNNFALNLSLYVAPEDKEIHQNIDAHLHGGIPVEDIDKMHYWETCPDLKHSLFAPLRAGFSQLSIPKAEIPATIETNASFVAQSKVFENDLAEWSKFIHPDMMAIDVDNDPKSVIALWGQSILDKFSECPSLVDAYDVYDQLLGYYNEILQDDLYMISRDGWNPVLNRPTKKSYKWSELMCDLLPVDLAVNHFLPELKAQLDETNAKLETLQGEMNEMLEEFEDDFDSSIFENGKFNEGNLKKKIEYCTAIKLSDEEKDFLLSLMPYFEKNNKQNKETVAKLCEQYDYLFMDVDVVNKKVVNTLLTNSEKWQPSTEEQRNHWSEYYEMIQREKALKGTIKSLDDQILKSLIEVYEGLTPEVVRPIVVEEKWLKEITSRVTNEMQTITHNITSEVTDLVSRYEHTLGDLNAGFLAKESAVLSHLKEMGFEL